jgi:hypothetical protein
VFAPHADAWGVTARRWLLLLVVLPTASAAMWWAGLLLVVSPLYPHGGGDAAFYLLALVAAVPAVVGMIWSLLMKALLSQRVWAFLAVNVFTAVALVMGAVILFVVAAAQCPPHAYECPI